MNKLVSTGPTVTSKMVTEFEDMWNLSIPHSLIEFWNSFGNGGRLKSPACIDLDYHDRKESPSIHGFYGLEHYEQDLNLERFIEIVGFPSMFPLAFDDTNGHFFIYNSCPAPESVWYGDFEDIAGKNPGEFVKVANGIDQFTKILKQL